MFFNAVTISDETETEYSIGFSVEQRDLGLWLNGNKLEDGDDYVFNQDTNSVTLCCETEVGDTLQFRLFRDKR